MEFVPFDPEAEVHRQRRHLPHWEQARRTYFVTFRLADSIPESKLVAWREEKAKWEDAHPKPWSEKEWRIYRSGFLDRLEKWSDNGYGECLLRNPVCREIVSDSLRHFHGDEGRYQISSFVIMPNHLHLLVTPATGWNLGQLIHSWKSFTAHEINKSLDREGTLWMDERFDHLVRNSSFLLKYQRYITNNPAKAKLAPHEFTHWTIT